MKAMKAWSLESWRGQQHQKPPQRGREGNRERDSKATFGSASACVRVRGNIF
ncbi:hypothetical protein J6590_075008 [Homalodisca vitripennis]|nr:hypothetical protein J6590_075008 [Homalodisca vitripennis]